MAPLVCMNTSGGVCASNAAARRWLSTLAGTTTYCASTLLAFPNSATIWPRYSSAAVLNVCNPQTVTSAAWADTAAVSQPRLASTATRMHFIVSSPLRFLI